MPKTLPALTALLALGLLAGGAHAATPSFDCAKASHAVE